MVLSTVLAGALEANSAAITARVRPRRSTEVAERNGKQATATGNGPQAVASLLGGGMAKRWEAGERTWFEELGRGVKGGKEK